MNDLRLYLPVNGYDLRLEDGRRTGPLESIQIGNHLLGIYDSKEQKLDAAFHFLKAGLDNNEVVMMVTQDMTREAILSRMKKEWKVDVDSLETKGSIVIKTTKNWYYPNGKMDSNRVVCLWVALSQLATIKGKKGLRVFGDVHAFFDDGRDGDLVRYEHELEKNFDIPVTAMCAYERKDLERSRHDLDQLKAHHVRAFE